MSVTDNETCGGCGAHFDTEAHNLGCLNAGDLETPYEPEPEDYCITDVVRGGYDVGIVEGKFLGHFNTYSEAQIAVVADMTASQFWPNVWSISDHGNAELVQLTI